MAKLLKTRAPKARVAIITRTRKRPVFLQRAMQSILAQTFKDFIWVIINDGDDKKSVEAIASKARARGCKVLDLHLPKQRGMEYAANHGIGASRSPFLVIHDDDDTWHPEFLAETMEALEAREDWLGVAVRVEKIFEHMKGERLTETAREPFMPWLRAIYLIDMLQQNTVPTHSLLFRRSAYQKLGGYDPTLPVLGDWDFNVRLLREGNIGLIDKVLAYYHQRHQEGPAGNTITSGFSLHAEIDAMIRNHWLRQDLKSGKFGLGSLASLARQHWAMWKLLYQLPDKR